MNKKNLSLINDYVAIYRLQYMCKCAIKKENNVNTKSILLDIIEKVKKIKENLHKIFEKTGLVDTSFLLLKQQLQDAVNTPADENYKYSLVEIYTQCELFEKKYTPQTKLKKDNRVLY